jgi:hypothetical protein
MIPRQTSEFSCFSEFRRSQQLGSAGAISPSASCHVTAGSGHHPATAQFDNLHPEKRRHHPQLPTQKTSAELTRSLQPNSIHQHPSNPGDHRSEPPCARETASTAGLPLLVEHLHALQPPGLHRTIQTPPTSTASSGENRRPFAPSPPTTSRCDPCRPCCVDAAVKTSGPSVSSTLRKYLAVPVMTSAWAGRGLPQKAPEALELTVQLCTCSSAAA